MRKYTGKVNTYPSKLDTSGVRFLELLIFPKE